MRIVNVLQSTITRVRAHLGARVSECMCAHTFVGYTLTNNIQTHQATYTSISTLQESVLHYFHRQ